MPTEVRNGCTETLVCGCTLDTSKVEREHRPDGNPYHLAIGTKAPKDGKSDKEK